MVVLAGSLHERDEERGLAHFVEHMAFNGTSLYPKETLIGVLQRHGLAFGADVSAFTFPTHTIYGLDVPSANAERLAEGFSVLREFADGQTFDPEEIERERGVIASERRARDNWQSRAGEVQGRFLFPLSLLSRRNPIGLESVIAGATAVELRRFYTTWYRPDNLLIIAVGDASPDRLEALVHEKFASMARPAEPLPPAPDLGTIGNPSDLSAALYSTSETGAVTLILNSVVAGPGGPETLALRTATMRRELVVDMLNERLGQLRRAHAQEFGDAAAFLFSAGSAYVQTGLSISTATITWRKAVEALAVEWRRVEEQGFTPEEIAEAVQRVRRRYEYAVAAAPTESSTQSIERIAGALVHSLVPASWAQLEAQMETVIAGFDATVARETFRELWRPGAPRLFALGNLALDEPETDLIGAWQGGFRRPLPPPPAPVLTELDYEPARKPGKIRHQTHIPDLDIHSVEFANGVRLNLKATKFNHNLVYLRARVGRGLLSLSPRYPGLNLLANSYLGEAGVGRHFGDDLRRFMAQRNLSLGFGVGEDAFIFTGGADSRGLPDLLLLLTAYLNDPGWRSADFQTARNRTILLYSEADREVNAALNAMAARVMSQDNPLFALPNPDLVSQRSFEQLVTWLDLALKDGPIELGLVGDFDIPATLDLAARPSAAFPAGRCARRRRKTPSPSPSTAPRDAGR